MQKGFVPLVFLFAILTLSGTIIGGSVYIQQSHPYIKESINKILNISSEVPANTKTDSTNRQSDGIVVPGSGYTKSVSTGDGSASKNYIDVADALQCHYSNRGSYPPSLNSIQKECTQINGFSIIDSNINKPFTYELLAGGKGYTLKATVLTDGKPAGQEFYVTDFENELLKIKHDSTRLTDLANLQSAINVTIQESPDSSTNILCKTGFSGGFCSGDSYPDSPAARKSDGSGWVKVDLASQKDVSVPILPVDPINNNTYHYRYCSNGNFWELNTALESAQQSWRMNDGGDDDNMFEVGSNLTLIGKAGNCRF